MGKLRYIPSGLAEKTKRALVGSIGDCLVHLQTEAIHPTGKESFSEIADSRAKTDRAVREKVVSILVVHADPVQRAEDIQHLFEFMTRHNASLEGMRSLLGYVEDFRQNAPVAPNWLECEVDPLAAKIARRVSDIERGNHFWEGLQR
ncbi:MAG: hypothetical protein V1827_00250 [Candidatus Micrarchaeota archaeon]